MKHFVSFIFVVFLGLSIAFLYKTEESTVKNGKKTLRVFGSSSFIGSWGPGPQLKKIFEKNCACNIDFIEGSDSGILIQRLKIEGESLGADVVVGIDQFDLSRIQNELKWRKITVDNIQFVDEVKNFAFGKFLPLDWGVISFVSKKGNLTNDPKSLDDLFSSEWDRQIALQDPRSSSPGLQFLVWLIREKGEERAFQMVKELMDRGQIFSPSWSTSYGLFTKGQAKMVLSYSTSPIYHLEEEKNNQYYALPFSDPHPLQVEFIGLPEFCNQCDLADKFATFLLTDEAQKIIMSKNYMFPVVQGIRKGTSFENIKGFKLSNRSDLVSSIILDKWIDKWSDLRRQVSEK